MQPSFPVSVLFSFGPVTRSGVPGSHGSSILILRDPTPFPTVAAPTYIPISRARGLSFPTSIPTLGISCVSVGATLTGVR